MSEDSIPEEFYEAYPEPAVRETLSRIWEKIEVNWGSEAGMRYLESLLLIEDDRTREGFTPDIMSELLLLGKLHEEAYPQFEAAKFGSDFVFGGDIGK